MDKGRLRFRVTLSLLCLLAAKLVNVYVPFLLKDAIDQLSTTEKALALPVAIIVAYGIARMTVQLFGELRDFIFIRVAQHAQRAIGLQTFKHLHDLSLDFHLSRRTGKLSRVIERGTRGIQFVLSFMTFNIVPVLVEIVLVTGIMLYKFDWIYAVVIFSTIFFYILITLLVTEWRLKFRRRMNSEEGKANSKAIDSLLNFETVKYFGNEKFEFKRFDENLERYEQAAIDSQSSLSLLNLLQSMIIGVGLICIMILAGRGVVDGKASIGDFVLVNTFLIQLYLPLDFLGFVYREIKQSLVDMDKMFDLIEINPSIKDSEDAEDIHVGLGEVELRDVTFGYRPERPILKNVSFKVSPGKMLAVVGPTGSGKSTVLRLLFRFFDTDTGSISVDGENIKSVTQESLRASMGVVPQDTVLFNDTIAYNIQYGRPKASMDEIKAAAKVAEIDHFIESLPDGYDTEVGERGLKLSGGEKQRIAIARTILKRPKIFLFDEATSALDSHTERKIQASLEKISENHTTIVVAHRLSTVVHADEIIVLKNGEIVEQGTHHDLIELNKEYAFMWSKQQEASRYLKKLKECEDCAE